MDNQLSLVDGLPGVSDLGIRKIWMDKQLMWNNREVMDLTACVPKVQRESYCRVCKRKGDLRMGSCFNCHNKVSGVLMPCGAHVLWETSKPHNYWIATG